MTLDQALVGQIEFQPAPLDLAGFCRDMVEEAQRSAGDRCMLTLVQPGECPPASLDIDLLRIILRNLLSNAVKFSPRGGAVQLELECVESRAILRIKDQGIGIPAADQAHLFEPFYRGHNTDDIFGVGLGLVTVKKAVDLHGGTIAVESQVRVGTTVTVTLPIQ